MEEKNELKTLDKSLDDETASIVEGALKSTSTSELKEITDLFNANQVKREIIRANSVNKLLDKILDQATERIENRGHEMTNKELLDYYNTFQDTVESITKHTELINQQPLIQINNNTQNISVEPNKQSIETSLGIDSDNLENVRDFISQILNKQEGNILDYTEKKRGVIIIGADNTGKTTLINKLKAVLPQKILYQNFQYDEIKNDTSDEYYNRVLNLFLENDKIVFERFTPIDELVYGKILHPNDNHNFSDLRKYFLDSPNLEFMIIYCRPPKDVALNFGDRAQFDGVKEHGEALIDEFDEVFTNLLVKFPELNILKYDFTNVNSYDIILSKITDFIGD